MADMERIGVVLVVVGVAAYVTLLVWLVFA